MDWLKNIFSKTPSDNDIVTVLDIGTSKVVCCIARTVRSNAIGEIFSREGQIEILGMGVCGCYAMKAGMINNMQSLQNAIKIAVAAAEDQAKMKVDSILVGIASQYIVSERLQKTFKLNSNDFIDEEALYRFSSSLRNDFEESVRKQARKVMHFIPIEYRLDGKAVIDNPIGMVGKQLYMNYCCVSVDQTLYDNLCLCVSGAHLQLAGLVSSPLASALSSLTETESKSGVICLDIGYETSSAAVFNKGRLIYQTTICCGSNHITTDIQKLLEVKYEKAEKLKKDTGSIEISKTAQALELNSIITARAEEILTRIKAILLQAGDDILRNKKIILTGGGSYLCAFDVLVESIFETTVAIKRPLGFANKPKFLGAGYSSVLGLTVYPTFLKLINKQMGINENMMKSNSSFSGFNLFQKKFFGLIC